jgi:uncharacterized protein YndB with AHSA1/START domain
MLLTSIRVHAARALALSAAVIALAGLPAIVGNAAHAQAAAGDGKVSSRVTTEPDGSRTLLQWIEVGAPVAQVWTALTTSEGWRSWAAPMAWVDFRLGGVIETSYQMDATAGSAANIRNQVVAYLPQRMLAIRNVQAPPNTSFDVPTFQSLHSIVLLDALGEGRTRVTIAQPGYGSGAAYEGVLKHFAWGNAWTLDKLRQRFDSGPVDWARLAAEAAAKSKAAGK